LYLILKAFSYPIKNFSDAFNQFKNMAAICISCRVQNLLIKLNMDGTDKMDLCRRFAPCESVIKK